MTHFLLFLLLALPAFSVDKKKENLCSLVNTAVDSTPVRGDGLLRDADPFWSAPERGAGTFQERHDKRSYETEAFLETQSFHGKTTSEKWSEGGTHYAAAELPAEAGKWYRAAAHVTTKKDVQERLFTLAEEQFRKAGREDLAARTREASPEEVQALKLENKFQYKEAGEAYTKAGLHADAARAFRKAAEKERPKAEAHGLRAAEELAKAAEHEAAALEYFILAEQFPSRRHLQKSLAELEKAGLSESEAAAEVLGLLGQKSRAQNLWKKVAQGHLAANRTQEAVWALRRAGENDKAQKLQADILITLQEGKIAEEGQAIKILGGGETPSFLVTFENGQQAVFKPELRAGENAAEANVSLIDRHFENDQVPLTTYRKIQGKTGSIQAFIPEAVAGYRSGFGANERQGDLAWFSLFVDNMDRHDDNVMRRPGSFRRLGIDNARALAFRAHVSGERQRSMDSPFRSSDLEDYVGKDHLPSQEFLRKLHTFVPTSLREEYGVPKEGPSPKAERSERRRQEQVENYLQQLVIRRKQILDYAAANGRFPTAKEELNFRIKELDLSIETASTNTAAEIHEFMKKIRNEIPGGSALNTDFRVPGATDHDLTTLDKSFQGGLFMVLRDKKKKIVGTIAYVPTGDSQMEIKKFYLDSKLRGQGLGANLLDFVIERTENLGAKTIEVQTLPSMEEANTLFDTRAFQRVGEANGLMRLRRQSVP